VFNLDGPSTNSTSSCPDLQVTLIEVSRQTAGIFAFPSFSLIEDQGVYKLTAFADSTNSVGTYNFELEVCQSYGTGTLPPVCVKSNEFVLTIVNPCDTAQIQSDIFLNTMQEYQLEAGTLNLNIAMPPNTWKWFTNVDIQANPSLSSLTCPAITYQILEVISGTPTPTDLVVFDPADPSGNTLRFAPTLSDAPGVHNMIFRGVYTKGGYT